MRRVLSLVVLALLIRVAFADEKPTDLPWKVNKPIVTVKKSVYLHTSGASTWVTMEYVGPKLTDIRRH